MTDIPLTAASEPAAGSDRISLRTLVPIRWVAIAGQALAILTVHYGLRFHLPLAPALAVVAGSVLLNLVLIVYRQWRAGSASVMPRCVSAMTSSSSPSCSI